jgi:hypothetical protein
VQVMERIAGRYDVEEVEFGRVYRWRPESIVVECFCGERLSLTSSATVCSECGADHAIAVQESLPTRQPGRDKVEHPWRYWNSSEGTGLPL